MASLIIQEVCRKQADENTIYHCLYGYFFLKKTKKELAKIYNKNRMTISRWIFKYENEGTCSNFKDKRKHELKKFTSEHHNWIVALFQRSPLHYLEEAKFDFKRKFNLEISASSICRILASYGYTWKVIERRAIQIKNVEIINYFNEIGCISWDLSSLLFLDEVSFDH
jgi:transposase